MSRECAAFVACSDPLSTRHRESIERLADILREEGMGVKRSPYLYECPEARSKAGVLNAFFADPEVGHIFDLSGGDLANTVLPYLDYEMIRRSRARMYGFSDLTTVLNAVITRAGRETVNWQLRNLLGDHAQEQRTYFREKILGGAISTEDLELRWLRTGSAVEGRILGGNLRCLLKLAGTPFWPDLRGAVLLLESNGGGLSRTATALAQLEQLGVTEQVRAVILGTFTDIERKDRREQLRQLVLNTFPGDVPVAETRYIGHYPDARAVVLGRMERFEGRHGE